MQSVCDSCHSRKVRCDRQNPCGNCQDAGKNCERSRQSRRAQCPPRQQNITALDTRLSRLEDAVVSKKQTQDVPSHASQSQSPSKSTPNDTNKRLRSLSQSQTERAEKRQTDIHTPTSHSHSHSMIEAEDLIRQELCLNANLGNHKRAMLNSAMSFIHQLSQSSRPLAPTRYNAACTELAMNGIDIPSAELLSWMLRETKGENMGPFVLDYFKHISHKSLKSMGLALLHTRVDDETLLLYSICVNSIVVKFLKTILANTMEEDLKEELMASANKHLASVRLAMSRIHLLAPPSVVYLQALLCCAFTAQGDGDTVTCWTLISTACQVCMDLGLHLRCSAFSGSLDEADEEVYFCFIWCYMLDKNYSMNLGRRSCLLDCDDPGLALSLMLDRPLSDLLAIYLELAEVQGVIVSDLSSRRISSQPIQIIEITVANLMERMQGIRRAIDMLRHSSTSFKGLYMESEVNTVRFAYHSIRTTLLRLKQLSAGATRSSFSGECLESARLAMSALHSVQIDASHSSGDLKASVSFMHWTILYYPLTPFFVLFCNVVVSSHRNDFELLQTTVKGLSQLSSLSSSIAKLQKLCEAFVGLLNTIIDAQAQTASRNMSQVESNIEAPHGASTGSSITEEQIFRSPNSALITAVDDSVPWTLETAYNDNIISNDLDISGLFDVQPTLDWLGVDFFNMQ